ncbi:MAG: hypothetical protein IPI90_11220 [Saprospiraceae bacterium]|nr:hypothetical protein [Candidatus Vicinibacter affinis]
MAISENRNELELSNWFIVGIISISLLLGFLIGNSLQPKKDFPWKLNSPPKSITKAIEWIILQEELLKKGYSYEQVKQVYQNYYNKVDYSEYVLNYNSWIDSINAKLFSDSIESKILRKYYVDDSSILLPDGIEWAPFDNKIFAALKLPYYSDSLKIKVYKK